MKINSFILAGIVFCSLLFSSCGEKTAKEFAKEKADLLCNCDREFAKAQYEAINKLQDEIINGDYTTQNAVFQAQNERLKAIPASDECKKKLGENLKKEMLNYTSNQDAETIQNYLELNNEICKEEIKKEFPFNLEKRKQVDAIVQKLPIQ